MSRVGKHPVTIPAGVTVSVADGVVTVKGKMGEDVVAIRDDVTLTQEDGKLIVTANNETQRTRAQYATTRALLNNAVKGVSEGFKRELELKGVGYRAAMQGQELVMQLGFSHEIRFPVPSDLKIETPTQTEIVLTSHSKQRVGQIAADIRSFRPPEPYKGKGVRYKGEVINMKEGKKK
ncbi:MAG TPA: 50S ribosomal protein L6 [Alphaproteobacteria bacterium]